MPPPDVTGHRRSGEIAGAGRSGHAGRAGVGGAGRPLGVGRVTRSVPPWLVRLRRTRDGGCRFPACGRQRWTEAHHLHHWAKGGRTDMENLALLCGTHHKLLHEGGWTTVGNPDGDLRFVRPDGRVLAATGPPGLQPEVRERFVGTRDDAA